MIDFVEFDDVVAYLGYKLWWLKDGAVLAVAEEYTPGFEKIGYLSCYGGRAVRM
jgi:hypothetical protein